MSKRTNKIITIVMVLIGALSWAYVAFRVYEIRSHRNFAWRSYLMNHHHRPISITDVSYISSWMTFDYITKVFKLPATYLKDTLKINDSKYPFVTLEQYAETIGTSTSAIIGSTQEVLRKYLASSTLQQ